MSKKTKKSKKHSKKQDPFLQAIFNTSIIVGSTALVMYVVVNIMASQLFPPLFEQIIDGKKNAMRTFYAIARRNNLKYELFDYVSTDEAQYVNDLYSKHRNRQELISYYESVLQSNPYARDVLYALAILYQQEKNTARSEYYMRQARMIDPGIEHSLL